MLDEHWSTEEEWTMNWMKLVLFLAAWSFAALSFGQPYPARPVRVIVPISPGSGTDIVARALTQKLSAAWGQPVIVENRPGAGGSIGAALVAKSPADGYTLLVHSVGAHAASAALNPSLPYDAVKDFVPIAPIVNLPQVIVVAPSSGIRSVAELIAKAKAQPGRLNFASPGIGSGVHFTGEKFRIAAGIDVVHVPYKGGPEAMTDVMMGRVTYWIPSIGTALPMIQDGRLLALGVTLRQRVTALPDVPTIAEAGVAGFEDAISFGMWAPAGTPPGIVSKIARDIADALDKPDLRDQYRKLAGEPAAMTPAEFARYMGREMDSIARIARIAGVREQ
jgi:tripartite-type tricarboxylate transporter receptor subunit TctC